MLDLKQQAASELESQIFGAEQIAFKTKLHLKYAGTDATIAIDLDDNAKVTDAFERLHQLRFGFTSPEKAVYVESVAVIAEAQSAGKALYGALAEESMRKVESEEQSASTCDVFLDSGWQKLPLLTSAQLQVGEFLKGPALIADRMSTIFLAPGWNASKNDSGVLKLARSKASEEKTIENDDSEKPNPIRLELFNHIFMSIAEQMGTALQNTSQSINIKERLDFSCAIFDQHGNLVANAPHIPVHLGSMSACVQNVIARRANDMQPGDAFVSNNPYAGGTHLPDITVISPVFAENQAAFYIASRGHHADIGGITPGSMPANSKILSDEGVVIDNFLLVRNGKFFESEISSLLSQSPNPARNIPQNIADLKAQVAANIRGGQALVKACRDFGLDTVKRYMQFVQTNSTQAVRSALRNLHDGKFTCELDNGAVISVSFEIDRATETATLDFSGTSQQLESNLNAPNSITNAASMYVLRTLIDDEIPLNQGFLTPLQIRIPNRSFLNPSYPAAIVAGNV